MNDTIGSSKTKSKEPDEFSSKVHAKQAQVKHFLRQPLAHLWTKYEFDYTDIEKQFVEANSFVEQLNKEFPGLKSRDLTVAEWRKLRSLVTDKKSRRFSPKFVNERRIALEKCRQRLGILQQNIQLNSHEVNENMKHQMAFNPNLKGIDLNSVAVAGVDSTNLFGGQAIQLCLQIIAMRKLLTAKNEAIAQLKKLNAFAHDQHIEKKGDPNPDMSVLDVVSELDSCNEKITQQFDKLMCFQSTKETLLLSSTIRLAPKYFRKRFEQTIFEMHLAFNSKMFIETKRNLNVMDTLMEYGYLFAEIDKIAINAIDYFAELSMVKVNCLQTCMSVENLDYFNEFALPSIISVLNKLCIF